MASGDCGSELRDVGIGHPVEPVKPFGLPWCEAHQHSGARGAIRQQGRARQRVRAAARSPDDCEALKSVGVGNCGNIFGGIGYTTAYQPVGSAIPRAVERDQAHPELMKQHATWPRTEPAAWGAMEQKDRAALWITRYLHPKPSAVGCIHSLGHAALPRGTR
jgi:hypothetical protein